MLACYLTWHLRRAWAPLTFTDEYPPQPGNPVAPARRSPAAQAKASAQRDAAGQPYRSFRSGLPDAAQPRDCAIAGHGDFPEPRRLGARLERMGWYGRSGTGRYGPGAGRRLAMGEALTIRVRRDRGYAIVAVAGEVDIATVTGLRERLFELAASGRTLVVDLDQVSFIDSAGLAALVGAARRAAAHGASLQVVCTRPRTRQLFRLTGLDGQVPLARTLDGALESLAAARPAPAS